MSSHSLLVPLAIPVIASMPEFQTQLLTVTVYVTNAMFDMGNACGMAA